jgi:hypothetical protein
VKKARYAFAVLGAAPALGMMAPAALAAPATTHAPARPAKTVRLGHTATPALHAGTSSPATSPQYTCHSWNGKSRGASTRGNFHFSILHYGHCVDSQFGYLDTDQAGLTERIRGYSQYGTMTFWRRIGGKFEPYRTAFPRSSCGSPGCTPSFSGLNWNPVYQICAALVLNNTNTVVYGPVCLEP